MSFSRRLKIRYSERHSERTALHLIFSRPDYDCRRDLPRSLRFEKWKASLAERIRTRLGA